VVIGELPQKTASPPTRRMNVATVTITPSDPPGGTWLPITRSSFCRELLLTLLAWSGLVIIVGVVICAKTSGRADVTRAITAPLNGRRCGYAEECRRFDRDRGVDRAVYQPCYLGNGRIFCVGIWALCRRPAGHPERRSGRESWSRAPSLRLSRHAQRGPPLRSGEIAPTTVVRQS
jgi:hypothetical protein